MIIGNNIRKISRYLPLDSFGEGYTWIKPNENQSFDGHPYGYHTENSFPFIAVMENGKIIKTINASDCSEIEFA